MCLPPTMIHPPESGVKPHGFDIGQYRRTWAWANREELVAEMAECRERLAALTVLLAENDEQEAALQEMAA